MTYLKLLTFHRVIVISIPILPRFLVVALETVRDEMPARRRLRYVYSQTGFHLDTHVCNAALIC